jgi:spore coat polysaccharide biosynthesis protein SpsF
MKQKIVAILQARNGSQRLPGKVMMDILGKPMLWHIIKRLKKSKLTDEVVVATTTSKKDDLIVELAQSMHIGVFRGSEQDVLDRYYKTAVEYKADIIVRVTADCPLIDPRIIDKVIEYFLEGQYDYVTNTFIEGDRIKLTFPDGLDTEVFSFKALEKAWKEAKTPLEREHATSYIWKNPTKFKLGAYQNNEDLSTMRWTVDYELDLEFVRQIYEKLGAKGEIFYMEDIVELLRKNPRLCEINKAFAINQEYYKQIEKQA